MLIACPTCGRLQFDMDRVVADIERRLEAYADPIEVAVLGCAVNGIGEASHADFGITGAKNEGLIFSRGKALKKVPQDQLVDELFKEIDKYVSTKRIDVDAAEQAAGAEWLQRIEEENAGELTPERLAKLEAESPARRRGRDGRGVVACGWASLHACVVNGVNGVTRPCARPGYGRVRGWRPGRARLSAGHSGPRRSCPGRERGSAVREAFDALRACVVRSRSPQDRLRQAPRHVASLCSSEATKSRDILRGRAALRNDHAPPAPAPAGSGCRSAVEEARTSP